MKMFENAIDLLREIPKPLKVIVVGLFFSLLLLWVVYLIAGKEAADNIRNIQELKENLTKQSEDVAVNSGVNVAEEIKTAFDKAGENMAKDVKDPGVQKMIRNNMSFAGTLFGLLIVLSILLAIMGKR